VRVIPHRQQKTNKDGMIVAIGLRLKMSPPEGVINMTQGRERSLDICRIFANI